MAERRALVEHKALAAPSALGLRHLFQISEDAALEVINLRKAAREQMAACFLAADTAGTEHRDPAVFEWIEMFCGKVLELTEACKLRIAGARKRAHADFEGIAGVEQQRVGRGNQRIPIARRDIDADLPRRISPSVAKRDDLLFQTHFQPPERDCLRGRELQFEVVQPAPEEVAMAQFR